MRTYPGFLALAVLAFLLIAAIVLLLWRLLQQRRTNLRRGTEVFWFSSLHFFSRELSECQSAQQLTDHAVRGALDMLDAQDGYILLEDEAGEEVRNCGARGLTAATSDRLSSDALSRYLSLSTERWGTLMVFPDLRRPEVVTAWQRDPLFYEFRNVLRGEGLRTVLAVGLQVREKSYGVLLVGFRNPRSFEPQELRVALAVGNQIAVAVENWLLNRAEERREEEMKVLHRVGESLLATFDLNAQIEILRRELSGLTGGSYFDLSLQESADGPLEVAAPPENGAAAGGSSQPCSLAHYVCRTRQPLLVTEDVPSAVDRLGLAPMNSNARAWCGVPVHFSDGSVGVFALTEFERDHALTKRQFDLVQVLAQEAVSAIENARLFKREQRRSSHLALLNELGRKASSVLDPEELLSSICRQIRSAFGYDLARIEIMDAERGELVVEAEAGYGPDLLGRRIRKGEGLAGRAADGGEPVLANAVAAAPDYVALHPGVRAALSLPLKYRDGLLGVLSFESKRVNAFSQQDVLTLRTLADQLAIALHNARAYQVALEQAITDGLTGLKTHRYFMEALDREWRRSTRSGQLFSIIMMDLDGFKLVNDRHGHLEGDKVLTAVAHLIHDCVRQSNVMARYGGDEFAILMPETRTEQAEILAERLRARIEADRFLAAHRVTASFGIATFPVHGPTEEDILRVADSGMYLAKHQEGNCVRVATLTLATAPVGFERQLLEAYLGVSMKRMFSTGPELFNHYLERFQQVMANDETDAPTLLDTVTALAFAIDAKDHSTKGHCQSVSQLAVQIARQCGLDEQQVEEVRLGGILHDIGKIGVPESVLKKPSLYTSEELAVMRTHTVLGEKILEPLKVRAIQAIRSIVRNHHEMVNGKGYPDGLRGENIPLGARIVTVADSFDTMVTNRYKPALSRAEAVEELRRCSGSQFDPQVVEAFLLSLEVVGDPRRIPALKQSRVN